MKTKIGIAVVVVVLIGVAAFAFLRMPRVESEFACEQLGDRTLDRVDLLGARAYSGGQELSPSTLIIGIPWLPVPASCRVSGVIHAAADSDIGFELWLPRHGEWNGRFEGVGNGGLAGSVQYLPMIKALQVHYAVASTDTGHVADGGDARWALGHPEKQKDYFDRAIHLTAVTAKTLVAAYYGKPADHAYFSSCSNGGRQALVEAQRYPEDYEGIVAGAPAADGSNHLASWAWRQQVLTRAPGAAIPYSKLKTIAAATLKACDALDGLADGVIDDPRRCHFDPATLLCTSGDRDGCLTAPQVESLKQLYAGPGGALGNSRNLGLLPGGEEGLGGWVDITGRWWKPASQRNYVEQYGRYLIHDDPQWSLAQFDFARDRVTFQQKLGPEFDATQPDLSAFQARGGKLILYHGWSDVALQPQLTIDYYESVRRQMGEDAADGFTRLYLLPGLQHCFGGPGPNNIGQMIPGHDQDPAANVNAALEAWVERGQAPQALMATRYASDYRSLVDADGIAVLRQRPVCPYPQVARWKGSGSTDVAANFACVAPPP